MLKSSKIACFYLVFVLFSSVIQAEQINPAYQWSYQGDTGPELWSQLSADFSICASGKRQSPVDVYTQQFEYIYPLTFQYQPTKPKLVNDRQGLKIITSQQHYDEVTIANQNYSLNGKQRFNSKLKLGDTEYSLLQFHFHTPGEHVLNGKHFPMEAHLVHQNKQGNKLVIGVFFQNGPENPLIGQIISQVNGMDDKTNQNTDGLINFDMLLPTNREYFFYSGSLTTPPCDENINWLVMKHPVQASNEQINKLEQIMGNNARPLQPINWRKVIGSL